MVAQTGSHINIDFTGNLKTNINSNGICILNPIRNQGPGHSGLGRTQSSSSCCSGVSLLGTGFAS